MRGSGYLFLLLVITGLGAAMIMASFDTMGLGHAPGVTPVMTAQNKTPPERSIAVLFIGNSYTFFNNMPGMLPRIAQSDPENRIALEVKAVTRGGSDLGKLWKEEAGRAALQERRWDYVVLQDQSFWAMTPGSVAATREAVALWTGAIHAAGAKAVLFMPWPRKPGSDWFTKPEYPFLKDAENMHQKFYLHTHRLGQELGADVVPVGDYWLFAAQEYPDLSLYAPDGSHPALGGSYLTALAFYRFLTGQKPESVTYVPPGLGTEDARTLRMIASYGE